MFDLIATIELTASATVVAFAFAFAFGRDARERALIGAGFAAWFVAVIALGATALLDAERGLGVPALAATIVLPTAVLVALLLATRSGRARLADAPLPALIAVHAVRLLGITFVLLHAAGRLPAPFAPVAGWGDIAVGLLAVPVAVLVARRAAASGAMALAWSALGIVDLATAVGLGAMSSPGPVRIFFAAPGSAMMTTLPWIVIPCFLVPALMAMHIVTVARLLAAPAGSRRVGVATTA